MNKKVLHTVFGLCMFAGIMIMLGAAGSSDLGITDFKTVVIHTSIGMVVMLVGYFGAKFSDAPWIF